MALTLLAVIIGVTVIWQGEETPSSTHGGTEQSPAAQPTVDVRDIAMALAQLRALHIGAESSAAYDRDSYGQRWSDVESNGCNQRDDRLLIDAVRGTAVTAVQGACDHDVLTGQWVDPYTGALLVATDLKDQTQAMSVTIDHVVPLAEAHRFGAAGWAAERRLFFANDLAGLRVVAGDVNSSKSDQDPAQWLPVAGMECWYAATWIGIKTTWQLSIDPAELEALQQVLAGCFAD